MTKSLIEAEVAAVQRLYIDELGRASRDAVEALRLGQLMDSCGKRLIGVTDGFDSASPNSKLLLSIYSGLHEWFVEQLRQKVSRGMRDAFEKGKNLRPPPLGYKLVPILSPDGTPMLNPNGRVIKERAIDDEVVPHIREAYRLFIEERWSPFQIARRFNELLVKGRNTWSRQSIADLLKRTDYIGIEYDGKTRSIRDRKTGAVQLERRPKEQWRSRQVPHLRLISDEVFGQAQQRLQECNEAYTRVRSKPGTSRNEVYPTMLIRPVCKSCGSRLILASTGKYMSIYCHNGRLGANGCQLKTCKSLTLFDRKIVGFLHQHVLTKDEIIIDQIPKYELLAPTFKELHDKGNSIQDLAAAYEMPPSQVAKILRYAETGQRPRKDRTTKGHQAEAAPSTTRHLQGNLHRGRSTL